MAQVVLAAVGTAFAGPLGGIVGGLLGGVADRALVSALTPPMQIGSRLSGLELHSTSVGAPMAAVFGRARVAGQTIWAARFKEHRIEQSTGGGKGGGATTVSYSYSLSFAVGLCEGAITGIGRVWADGTVLDISTVAYRLHLGGAEQDPDALIEAVEGSAPAYRGTAYLVFEDMPLDTWGNRPPQLNVEIFHPPPDDSSLEAKLTSVNLIPGAGEFVLSPTPELRGVGDAVWVPENVNNPQGVPDLMVALDQLQALLPRVDHVNLVVAWFGTDLRCGRCQVRPGVDSDPKVTTPDIWRVEVDRDHAHLISQHGGGAAYGGTPSDSTVLACIAELNRRGLAVTLYPFLMMDVPEHNVLPDPYGGVAQGAYPWRGRITGEVAPGHPSSTDLTAAAATQVAAFFGSAASSDFQAAARGVGYIGDPDEWSWRRCVLHYARLAAMSAGVESFLVGSELRGLTTLRSAAGVYPAVDHLRILAADVKAVLGPGVKVGYSGDWSEWFGHQPPDGCGEVRFHLDPLWADPAIDFVGIDFYEPLADWREGAGGLDAAAGFLGPHDGDYLRANVLGAENADWFYASAADRTAQHRTPITDGAYAEPWVYRSKDLRAWWSNLHHDRPGGVRATAPTSWTPGLKPIRLIEFGCPAVDRGANAPNLFVDPKSSESDLPIDSTGTRDDTVQRRALEAVLGVYGPGLPDNPPSPADGRPMIERLSAWCWDARPYPDFPNRGDVWKDAPNWTLGHWLNGRVGQGDAYAFLSMILGRAGLGEDGFSIEGVSGRAYGYVASGPLSTADTLRPLTEALDFDAAEHGGRVALVGRTGAPVFPLAGDDMVLPDDSPDPRSLQRTLAPTPDLVRVRYLDEADSYQAASVVLRAVVPGGGGPAGLDLPVVLDGDEASLIAARRLARALSDQDALTLDVAPVAALRAEAGDLVAVEGVAGAWRVVRVDLDETPRLQLTRVDGDVSAGLPAGGAADPRTEPPPQFLGPPAFQVLDLPPLPGAENDIRPLAAVAASPWRAFDVSGGPSAEALTMRGRATEPAIMGLTASALPPGPLNRFDRTTRLIVHPAAGAVLTGFTPDQVLAGAGALAVTNAEEAVEVLQFTAAEPTGDGGFVLSGLLRGQLGTEDAMIGVEAGAPFVLLGPEPARLSASASERGSPLVWRAAPSGGPPGGIAMTEVTAAWRAKAWRPFSPAQLRGGRTPTGLRLTWVRRARIGGDSWTGEVPLEEPVERYRVSVLAGALAGDIVADAPVIDLTPPDLTSAPYLLPVRVAQWGGLWGDWGATLERSLLL